MVIFILSRKVNRQWRPLCLWNNEAENAWVRVGPTTTIVAPLFFRDLFRCFHCSGYNSHVPASGTTLMRYYICTFHSLFLYIYTMPSIMGNHRKQLTHLKHMYLFTMIHQL